ncbi:hypothetical protein BSL78_08281, partial [Apostichopus japonicus]
FFGFGLGSRKQHLIDHTFSTFTFKSTYYIAESLQGQTLKDRSFTTMHSNTKTPDDATYFIGSSSAIVQPEHQPPRDYGACAPHGQVMGRNLNEVHLQPNSFMATAIFTTLCCNFVFGLIAVIFASRQNKFHGVPHTELRTGEAYKQMSA